MTTLLNLNRLFVRSEYLLCTREEVNEVVTRWLLKQKEYTACVFRSPTLENTAFSVDLLQTYVQILSTKASRVLATQSSRNIHPLQTDTLSKPTHLAPCRGQSWIQMHNAYGDRIKMHSHAVHSEADQSEIFVS